MSGRLQRQLRQFHRYCSVFFAPAILFFAFSGLLQTVRLNDATPAGPAPAWIKWMAAIHKDQDRVRIIYGVPMTPGLNARVAADSFIQMHGGAGFTWEFRLHHLYRAAMFARHYLTNEDGLRQKLAASIRYGPTPISHKS